MGGNDPIQWPRILLCLDIYIGKAKGQGAAQGMGAFRADGYGSDGPFLRRFP